jgi:hypothetical protein
MAGCDLLLTTGDKLLQTDGVSTLLLAACVETPETGSGGGGAGTTQRFPKKWWDSHAQKPKNKRVVDYASQVAKAFSEATARDAKRLAERAETLERLVAESDYAIAYLEDTAERLREAAILAAQAETAKIRKYQLAVAAELAHRLEMELRDEEESVLLLLMV